MDELKKFKKWCRDNSYLYQEFDGHDRLRHYVVEVIAKNLSKLQNTPATQIDAYWGLTTNLPPMAAPVTFTFPQRLFEEDSVNFFVAYFEPESSFNNSAEIQWIKTKAAVAIEELQLSRNVIYREMKPNLHYSFKFFIEVPRHHKDYYVKELLKFNLIVTGQGEQADENRWRIWFLYAECPVHPHYTELVYLNHSLYKLPKLTWA